MALDLPERERAELAAWRDELIAGRGDLRPVKEEALHVTLAFLGWRPQKEIAAIAASIQAAYDERADSHAFRRTRFVPREVVSVPPQRARLFALDLEDVGGHGAELQQAVSDALEAGRFYKPEKRPFWPHVTLARVKRNLRAEPLPPDPPPVGAFKAAQVTLYRSTLRPQGAEYESLAEWRLPE